MTKERWAIIEEFPRYKVSDQGQVFNTKYETMMRTSFSQFGHSKITLTDDVGERHTRSVALLVAEAFVEPPNRLCDTLILLDGDFSNLHASNIMWRPESFAWKYTRQMKVPQPRQYHNLVVRNVVTGHTYNSIIDAGATEGLLFEDIWRSTYMKSQCFPTGSIFEVIHRV